ncbi:MAG: hypothetical protein CL840_19775 [Crocinitomicaceae bacterium]|mgnify:CR=1 FL=1|nr:hypothetical protein [Crocinitomicaceae bacterium]|tara:strand:- start:10630 stop:10944 length:315 start_codon:yes stop_codon:yes gene_type:complete
MTEKKKILLLDIIDRKANIKLMIHEGSSFKEISQILEALEKEAYIEYQNQKIRLTQKGSNYLNESKNLIKKRDKETWIEPESKNKIPKLEKGFIFLPNQNEIHF